MLKEEKMLILEMVKLVKMMLTQDFSMLIWEPLEMTWLLLPSEQ